MSAAAEAAMSAPGFSVFFARLTQPVSARNYTYSFLIYFYTLYQVM